MSKEYPGGHPENVMYNEQGIAIGLTNNGKELMRPAEYSATDREWLSDVVTNRGMERYTAQEKGYIQDVLNATSA